MIYKLKDLIDIKHGFAFPGGGITTFDNGVVLVTPGNFKIGGGFKEEKCKFFSNEYPMEYVLKANDLIVTMTDLSKEIDTLGYSALVPNTKNRVYLHNQRIGLVSIKSNLIDKKYLYWFMRSYKYQKIIASTSSGSTVHHTSPDRIKDVDIDLPEITIQRKIARLLSSIEDKIITNNKTISLLDKFGVLFIKDYCKNQSCSSLLNDHLNFINGFAFKSDSYIKKGQYKVITIKNVQDGLIDSHNVEYLDSIPVKMNKKCILEIGDVLISLTGNVGRVGIIVETNFLLNQRVAKFECKDKAMLAWMYFFFRSEETKHYLESISKGTAQQNLSPVETLKMKVGFNKIDEKDLLIVNNCFKQILELQKENINLSSLLERFVQETIERSFDVSNIEIED